jgi:hypothetical protein
MSPIFTPLHLFVVLEALAFAYLSFLAGTLALERLRPVAPSRLSFTLYRLLAGFGMWGLWGLLLGLFGIFTPLALWASAAAVLIASRRIIYNHLRLIARYVSSPHRVSQSARDALRHYTFFKLIAILWIVSNFLLAFLPITGHDALDYHLPIMEDIAGHERITFIPQGRNVAPFAYLPILGEIFNNVPTVMFGNISDPYVFQLIQYLLLVALLVLIYDFAKRRVRHHWLALVLALLLLSLMDLHREALHAGYVDILAYTFSFASMLLVVEASERSSNATTRQKNSSIPLFALSAAFLGLALSVKYTALFFIPINAAIFALASASRRMAGDQLALGSTAQIIGRYALIAFLIGGFWYIKNVINYGSPVYPMFSNDIFTKEVNFFLFDRTLANFILFPYLVFGEWLFLENGTSSRLVVTAYFVLTYGLLAFLAIVRRRPSFGSVVFSIAALMYFLQLFFTSHQIRFLLPGMILVPIAVVFLFDQCCTYLKEHWSAERFRTLLRISFAGTAIVFTLVLLANFRYFKIKYRYLIGVYDKETYILEIGGQ